MIIFLLFSSTFAGGNPVSWNFHPLNSDIIEIKDIENNILAVQIIANIQHNYAWFYNTDDGIATIQNPNGEVINMFPLMTDPASHLLVYYDNEIWLLPSNTQSSTPSTDVQPDDFKYDQCYSATSSSSPPISPPTQEALADEGIVGAKRKRQEDPGSAQQINPAKRQKDSSCEIKDNYYWRIHPNNDQILQIISSSGEIASERNTKANQTNSRSLNKGYLYTTLHGIPRIFKRDPGDNTCLLKAGFQPSNVAPVLFPEHLMPSKEDGSTNKEIFSKVSIDRSYLKDAAYWRIDPDHDEYLQFCDKRGNVLHTEKVINHNGKRKLNKGFLYMRDGRKIYTFKRYKSDKKNIEEHGFAPSHTLPVLFPEELVTSTTSDADPEQAEENSMQCGPEAQDGDLCFFTDLFATCEDNSSEDHEYRVEDHKEEDSSRSQDDSVEDWLKELNRMFE